MNHLISIYSLRYISFDLLCKFEFSFYLMFIVNLFDLLCKFEFSIYLILIVNKGLVIIIFILFRTLATEINITKIKNFDKDSSKIYNIYDRVGVKTESSITISFYIYLSVIDLKAIRAAVDTLFEMVSSSKPEIEIRRILHRSDQFVDELDYGMAEKQIEKLKEDKIKQKNFKEGLTTLLGALMQKQQCWEQCSCVIGSWMRNNPGKELFFM